MWGRTARAKRVQLQRSVTHKSESDMTTCETKVERKTPEASCQMMWPNSHAMGRRTAQTAKLNETIG